MYLVKPTTIICIWKAVFERVKVISPPSFHLNLWPKGINILCCYNNIRKKNTAHFVSLTHLTGGGSRQTSSKDLPLQHNLIHQSLYVCQNIFLLPSNTFIQSASRIKPCLFAFNMKNQRWNWTSYAKQAHAGEVKRFAIEFWIVTTVQNVVFSLSMEHKKIFRKSAK